MSRTVCDNHLRIQCALAYDHVGPCWSSAAEAFLGLSMRCGLKGPTGHCFRAQGHPGACEDGRGRLFNGRTQKAVGDE